MPSNKAFAINKSIDITAITLLLASVYTTAPWIETAFYTLLVCMGIMALSAFAIFYVASRHPVMRYRPMPLSNGWRGWSELAFDVIFSLLLAVHINFFLGLAWYAITLLLKTLVKRHNTRINTTTSTLHGE